MQFAASMFFAQTGVDCFTLGSIRRRRQRPNSNSDTVRQEGDVVEEDMEDTLVERREVEDVLEQLRFEFTQHSSRCCGELPQGHGRKNVVQSARRHQ